MPRWSILSLSMLSTLGLMLIGCQRRLPTQTVSSHPVFDAQACAERALRDAPSEPGVETLAAAQTFRRGCAQGDVSACSLLGVLDDRFSGRHQFDRHRRLAAWMLYRRACVTGYARGCANLAGFYQGQRAVELNAYACTHGVSEACDALASQYQRDERVEEAQRFSLTACLLRESSGCMRLARMHEERGQIAIAYNWFKEGCLHGDMQGCSALDRIFRTYR